MQSPSRVTQEMLNPLQCDSAVTPERLDDGNLATIAPAFYRRSADHQRFGDLLGGEMGLSGGHSRRFDRFERFGR